MTMTKNLAACAGLFCWAMFAFTPLASAAGRQATGDEIIREALARHEEHGTRCEDLTMVLTGPRGERSVRTMKSYFRKTASGEARFLLVVEAPPELAGVTLLVQRQPSGETKSAIYLPAFGKELKGQTQAEAPFLDTDFAATDFLAEAPDAYRYRLTEDARIDRIDYWVIAAQPRREEFAPQSGDGQRRIFVRKDTLLIARIDYLDHNGRLLKRQTRHDLRESEGQSWRAGMLLMEGIALPHQTLLKRTRTVFAEECAPEEMFTAGHIFANPRQAEGNEPEEGSGDTQEEAAE
jgi:hypothetical protein